MSVSELSLSSIAKLKKGDASAKAEFICRYAGVIRAFLRRGSDLKDLDDATQEVLTRLLSGIHRFEVGGPATLTTWVFSATHHFLIDVRKRKHLTLVSLDEGLNVPEGEAVQSPFQTAVSRETFTHLEAAIAQLPEAQRRVFVLAHVHEHPLELIAQAEGVPVGTVKSRIHRAKAELALVLAPIFLERGKAHDAS